MKTILTLLMATITFVGINAQSREEARRVILGDRKGNETYDRRNDDVVWNGNNSRYPTYPNGDYESERENRIYQINREYNATIYSVRHNRYLSNRDKEHTIRQLEKDRQKKIKKVNSEFDRAHDRYESNRHDNGKHRGWFKKNNKW